MPTRPKTICNHPGCGRLIDGDQAYCSTHIRVQSWADRSARVQADARRGSSADRGYGSKWQKARATYLMSHPLCRVCDGQGRVKLAKVVDHIVPHKGDQKLFWDSGNWQPLCASCHSTKTAAEDGGFGNRQVVSR